MGTGTMSLINNIHGASKQLIMGHSTCPRIPIVMHILGSHASDLIMEGAIAIRNGLKAEDIARTIHPHPSLSETVMESTHGSHGDMIHQMLLKGR